VCQRLSGCCQLVSDACQRVSGTPCRSHAPFTFLVQLNLCACIHAVSPPATTCVCVCVCVCVHVCVCVCVTWHGRMESHFTELADVMTLLLLQRLISLITLIVVVDAFEVYAILIRIDCLVTHWTDSTLLTSPLHKTRSSCDATFACSWNVHGIRIWIWNLDVWRRREGLGVRLLQRRVLPLQLPQRLVLLQQHRLPLLLLRNAPTRQSSSQLCYRVRVRML
jgi:hypothetical protein